MKYSGILFACLACSLAGCKTHLSLRDNSAQAVSTLADLNYQQVLDNVALFTANPHAMPAIGVFNAGTVTVQDQGNVSGSAQYSPTLTFAQQGGGGFILMLIPGFGAERQVSENWSLVPVTDSSQLRRLRCAFQLLVLGDEPGSCDDCRSRLERYFLSESDDLDCVLPRGWFHVGTRKDVPKDACHVGRYCDTYAWVTPEGRDGLTRFTMTVLDLATGKLHEPTRTVVRTYKADGSLDTTQVTTTEIDLEAVRKLQKDRRSLPERQRGAGVDSGSIRGLFFGPN